ncbi:glycosyltransferase [Mucilaginibacter litoreus]|uniref:Glycosyltransferase n=1 Tax=Mucilaginibacter litoreus TaxID=1048221 RepID=A0ABW3ATI0_9SPHI
MITVSIVIPTYRRPKLLINCLKALLLQKFDKRQYEIIVVSDGPDNETAQVFNDWMGYDYPVMRYLPLPQKKGPAAARNYGWLNARGSIIAFTDDDCLPDAHWLHEMVANCNPEEDVALTGKVIVPVGKRPTDYEQNTAHLQTADFITANCACTKKALMKAGGFDEQFSMAWREDSDLEFKFINNKIPIKKVESAVVVHPVRSSKWGVSVKEQKKTMYNALLYKKFPDLYRKKINQKSPVLYYCIIAAFMMMIIGLVCRQHSIASVGFAGWIGLTGYFIFKRLYKTSLSLSHIAEMIVTSFIIPFVSVYWQWYGAVKYRVLFI